MTDQDWALVRIIRHWPMDVGGNHYYYGMCHITPLWVEGCGFASESGTREYPKSFVSWHLPECVFNLLNKYLFAFAFCRSSESLSRSQSWAWTIVNCRAFSTLSAGAWGVRHLSSTLELLSHKSFVTPNDDDENVRRRMRGVEEEEEREIGRCSIFCS